MQLFKMSCRVLTVEWPSLLPFSSVTAMPFRISLKKERKVNKGKSLWFSCYSVSPVTLVLKNLLIGEHFDFTVEAHKARG